MEYAVLQSYIKETAIINGAYTRIFAYTTETNGATWQEAYARRDLLNSSLSRESDFGKYLAQVVESGSDRHYWEIAQRNF